MSIESQPARDLAAIRRIRDVDDEAFAAVAILCVAASLPVLAQEQKPENSQERPQDHYVPRLNTLMMVTQLGHFKLWYAGAVQNWPLANYEFGPDPSQYRRCEEVFHPDNSKSDMSAMTAPADDLEEAIKAKDIAKFIRPFPS